MLIDKIKILLKQEFISDILHTYSSKIVLILLGLVSNVIMTRSLGVSDYGKYILVMSIVILGMQFGSFGLHSANIYYVAKSRMLMGMLLKNSIIFSMISGSFIIIIMSVLYILYPKLFGINKELFILAMLMIPFFLMSLFGRNILIGIGKIKLDNKISVYTRVLSIILMLLVISFFSLDEYSAVVISAIILVVGLLFVFKELKNNIIYRYKISFKLFKKISKFGFKAYLSGLFAFLVFKSDLFFVNYYLSKNDLGYYSLAVSFIDYVYILPVVIGTILFQKLSSIKNSNDKYETMKKLSFYFTIFYTFFLVSIYFISEFLITTLYGEDFINSVMPINILLIAIFFMGMQTIQVQYLNATGYPKAILYYWMISLVVNIIINILFIEQYGLLAVAISTAMSYCLIYIFITLHIYQGTKHDYK